MTAPSVAAFNLDKVGNIATVGRDALKRVGQAHSFDKYSVLILSKDKRSVSTRLHFKTRAALDQYLYDTEKMAMKQGDKAPS